MPLEDSCPRQRPLCLDILQGFSPLYSSPGGKRKKKRMKEDGEFSQSSVSLLRQAREEGSWFPQRRSEAQEKYVSWKKQG